MLTFLSFRAMVGAGTLMPLLCIWAFMNRNRLTENTRLLKTMLFAIPLPYIAIEAGWVVAEVGRQPWIVNGLMKTADAVSPIVTSQVAFSLVALTLLYALLGAVDIYLLFKFAKKGPAEA
jgi:cytochrome d ubiquinol oxidase subunit I